MGRATYSFDYDSFHDNYVDKIKINAKNSEEIIAQGLQSSQTPDELLADICIDQSLDQTEYLSNGDVVTLTWNCRDDLAKEYFNCNLELQSQPRCHAQRKILLKNLALFLARQRGPMRLVHCRII